MHIRTCADLLVSLREHFLTDDGRPDWTGRTWPYRACVRELYSRAGISQNEAPTLQAAIRYHAGNVLRERLTPEELEELGIGPEGPRERTRAAHSERSAVLATLRGAGSPADALRAVAMVAAVLDKVTPEQLERLRAQDRRKVTALLRRVAERADQLLAE